MPSRPKESIKSIFSRRFIKTKGKYFIWPLYALISIGLILFFAYHLAYAGKIIPHTFVGPVEVSNKPPRLAQQKISAEMTPSSQEIVFTWQGQSCSFTPEEIGFEVDYQKTIDNAYMVGRSGSFWGNTRAKLTSWFDPTEVSPVYRYNQNSLQKRFSELCVQIDRSAQQAQFSYHPVEGLVVIPEENGYLLNRQEFKDQLFAAFLWGQEKPQPFPVEVIRPDLNREDLANYRPQVSQLISSLPTLNFEQKTWPIDENQALSLLEFSEEGVSVSSEKLDYFTTSLAEEIDVNPKGEVFEMDGPKVVSFAPSKKGHKLNQEEAAKLIKEALLSVNYENLVVDLPVEEVSPPGGGNNYGIEALLGEGVSTFSGSSPGRTKNITVAAGRISGTLVAPGEEFSFNNTVGEISTETGYAEAYIIKQGRTVLGEGGGVCQVSTTLFRAAFWAGLPITDRTAHDYRVSYYEPPLGMDATVYNPTVDLKFKNDTPAYILIQANWDLKGNSVAFKIFGTDDGRVVTMDGPIVHSQSPAPEPLYQDDPSLPKGTTKQVEFASPGAQVTVNRLVKKGEKILQEDSFYSNYRPWQAIFKVGTGGG